MRILTCKTCHSAYLDLGAPQDPERLRWFSDHGGCTRKGLEMDTAQTDAALRMLLYADAKVSH